MRRPANPLTTLAAVARAGWGPTLRMTLLMLALPAATLPVVHLLLP